MSERRTLRTGLLLVGLLTLGLPTTTQAALYTPATVASGEAVQYAAKTKKAPQAAANNPALDRLYASLARAQSAASIGNMNGAHAELGRAQSAAQGLGASYAAWLSDLQQLNKRQVVAVSDVQGLLAGLSNLEKAGQQQPTSALLSLDASTTRTLGGLQTPLSVFLALLALGPLYLFRRTLGRSGHWRGLWLGVTLLLLPTLLGGLWTALGTLGAVTGLGPLQSALSLIQASWLWLARGLCTLVALGFMGYYLWHIAQQFGVVGKPKKAATLTEIKSGTQWEIDG